MRRADYEIPEDQRLRVVLDLMWPLQALVRTFVRHLGEPWLNGKIAGRGIKVGPRQLPALDRLRTETADLVGVSPPELFVVQSAKLETTLLGVGSHNTLALPSALLESVNEVELAYLLGREMGHVKSEHVLYLTLLQWLKDAIGSSVKAFALPAMAILYRWKRIATLSADRAGLIAGQDVEVAARALLKHVAGSVPRANEVNPEEYARHGLRDILRHPLKSAPELLEETPFMPRRIARLYQFRASRTYAELFPKESE